MLVEHIRWRLHLVGRTQGGQVDMLTASARRPTVGVTLFPFPSFAETTSESVDTDIQVGPGQERSTVCPSR